MRHQNETLIVIDMRDEKLVEVLKQAVVKGQEVVITNFAPDYSKDVKVWDQYCKILAVTDDCNRS